MGPYLDQITQKLKMDVDFVHLLVGSVSLGGLIGCVISGRLADILGRKKALSVTFSLTTMGWLLVACSFNSVMIFSGRIIHGIGEGIGVALSIIYLGELIEEKYRGGAIASVTVSCQFGIALAYIFGVGFPWRVLPGWLQLLTLFLFFVRWLYKNPRHG